MNRHHGRDQHKDNANEYLRRIDETYVFDETSGIYKPIPYTEKQKITHQGNVEINTDTIRTDTRVRRDWIDVLLKAAALLVSLATLVLLYFTVRYAKKQWEAADRTAEAAICANNTAQAAIKQNRDQFEKDQEPVIWVTPQSPAFALGQSLQWNIQYSNYGRSPALNVRICDGWSIGLNALKFRQSASPTMTIKCSNKMQSRSVLPPNYPQFFTISTGDSTLTQPDINAIERVHGGLVGVGYIQYEDVSGHSYLTTFCDLRLIGGAIAQCPKYNEYKRMN